MKVKKAWFVRRGYLLALMEVEDSVTLQPQLLELASADLLDVIAPLIETEVKAKAVYIPPPPVNSIEEELRQVTGLLPLEGEERSDFIYRLHSKLSYKESDLPHQKKEKEACWRKLSPITDIWVRSAVRNSNRNEPVHEFKVIASPTVREGVRNGLHLHLALIKRKYTHEYAGDGFVRWEPIRRLVILLSYSINETQYLNHKNMDVYDLTQQKMSILLGYSVTTINKAIRMLKDSGFLDILPAGSSTSIYQLHRTPKHESNKGEYLMGQLIKASLKDNGK